MGALPPWMPAQPQGHGQGRQAVTLGLTVTAQPLDLSQSHEVLTSPKVQMGTWRRRGEALKRQWEPRALSSLECTRLGEESAHLPLAYLPPTPSPEQRIKLSQMGSPWYGQDSRQGAEEGVEQGHRCRPGQAQRAGTPLAGSWDFRCKYTW